MLFSNIVSFFLLEFIVLLSSLLFLGFVGAREFSSWLVLFWEVLPPCILSCLPMWMVAIQRDIFLRYKIGLLRLKTLFIPLGIYPFGARPPARGDFFGVLHSVSLWTDLPGSSLLVLTSAARWRFKMADQDTCHRWRKCHGGQGRLNVPGEGGVRGGSLEPVFLAQIIGKIPV